MTDYFGIPARWEIPDYVWGQSFDDMAIDGRDHREGVALWLGTIDGADLARVSRTVLLRGPGLFKTYNQLAISADLMNAVADAALDLDLMLVGQIHSHSPLGSTELSYPDRYLGITEPGYLSLVAPDFALRPETRLEDCGVHLHEGETGWRRLGLEEIARRFTRPVGSPIAPLTVGSD